MTLSTTDALKHIKGSDSAIEIKGDLLKSYQSVLVMILKDLDKVCKENGISYTLGGGTCLGALRHHGFIPWDDDIDINMPRADYERFAKLFPQIMGEKYWLHDCWLKGDYNLAFPRVRLKGTTIRSHTDFGQDECGIFADIFIIENIPNNALLRNLHGFVSLMLGLIYSCTRFREHEKSYLDLVEEDSAVYKTFKKKAIIGKLFSFRSANEWAGVWDKWNSCVKNNDSKYVSVPVGRKHYFGELHKRADYFPPSKGDFENLEVSLPANPELYLTQLYGHDYMNPPASTDQETHVVLEFDLGKYANE